MIRVPDDNRIEVRLADGAANPYLLQSAVIGAGLHGIANNTDPGNRYDIDMYADGHLVKDAPRLPMNMVDALRLFEKSAVLPTILGEELCRSYAKLKHLEWNDFTQHFSEWEHANAIDI